MFGRIFELSHFDLDVWYSSSSSHNIGQVRRSRSLEVYGYGKCCRRDPEYFNFAVLFAFFFCYYTMASWLAKTIQSAIIYWRDGKAICGLRIDNGR